MFLTLWKIKENVIILIMHMNLFRKIFWIGLSILAITSNRIYTQSQSAIRFDPGAKNVVNMSYWQYSDSLTTSSENKSNEIITLKNLSSKNRGLHWIRSNVQIEGNINDSDILGIHFFNLPVAFEVYWDGIIVGTNGKIGNSIESEIPGKVSFILKLGRKNSNSGIHEIAVRISNFKDNNPSSLPWIGIGYESVITEQLTQRVFTFSVYIGLYFGAFLFCISVYLLGWREHSFLFFSGFTLFYFLICIWYLLIYIGEIGIIVGNIFNPLFDHGHSIALIILVLFTISFFDIKNKWKYAVSLLALELFFVSMSSLLDYFLYIQLIYIILSLYALSISVLQIKKKIAGTYILIGAMMLNFISNTSSLFIFMMKLQLNLSFIVDVIQNVVFVSLIMIAVSKKIQERNKKYQEVLLLTNRLESELLKKSIQPHFLMNTLLSLKSWLSKDSEKAEKMIDALANQFLIINKISQESEIPVMEEIALCKSHLELMGYRFNAEYKLITKGELSGLFIPPLIFHTLIENGITHAYLPKESGTFLLSYEKVDGQNMFCLSNDGSQIKAFSENSNSEIVEGLGLKYVKTRLEEKYPGKWKLNYGMKDKLWEVCLSIKI